MVLPMEIREYVLSYRFSVSLSLMHLPGEAVQVSKIGPDWAKQSCSYHLTCLNLFLSGKKTEIPLGHRLLPGCHH